MPPLALAAQLPTRTVTGGTLKLAGSNTFRVNTDLAAGTADKFTFDSLAAGSSKAAQYITVGYDAALDPYKEGSIGANGRHADRRFGNNQFERTGFK